MRPRQLHNKLLAIFILHLAIVTIPLLVNCHSANIKIQVNNENLQRAPYLLEAIKRATESEQLESGAGAAAAEKLTGAIADVKVNEPPRPTVGELSSDINNYKTVEEESIEEVLNLQPESVLKLAPANLMDGIAPQEHAKFSDMAASASNEDKVLPVENPTVAQRAPAHSQLSVTSSHLKRPSVNLREEENKQADANGNKKLIASSQVAPSVAAEEESSISEKKANQVPPDTWEPSQVMQGITNSSVIPATIKREYGHNSRTRITLGGGYVRDKSPPQASSQQSSRPPAIDEQRNNFNKQLPGAAGDQADDTSRVIEVPERIVMPESIFDQQPVQPSGNKISITTTTSSNSSLFRDKLDSRCPQRGTTTLEHPTACDKYFLCQNGYLTEKTCPNGLLYGSRDYVKDFCVHRWQVVCGDKSIPNPISTPGCRWQYGIFNVQGSPKCSPDFYECTEGMFEVKKCSISGQVYDDRTKSCQYAERVGCAEEALADFQCPPDDQGNTYWPFPRYFLNDRALIHCVNDKPAIVRCRDDERVDPEHLHCVLKSPAASQDSTAALESAGDGLLARRAREKKKKVEKTVA